MKPRALGPLSFQHRADLFSRLAAMEQCGLPQDKAFSLTRLPGSGQARVDEAGKRIKRGQGVADAGLASGLFTPLEAALVGAAIHAGSPASTYQRLADRHAARADEISRMKIGFIKPAATLAIALLIQPLPSLVAGSIGLGAYLWSAAAPLLLLAAIAKAIAPTRAWLATSLPAREAVDARLLRLPLFGPMLARRQARDFFESLALLADAGVPLFEALPKAFGAIQNATLRRDFSRILPALQGGATLAEAVSKLESIKTDVWAAFIGTGEASGTLPQMLFRHSNAETASIELFHKQASQWLPRVAYAIVAGRMISQLLGAPD
jgi:general secretion pathway protein F